MITARILARTFLHYAAGADAALDRPAHVRAASGLCWFETSDGPRLVVVQDDAHFVALVHPDTFVTDAVPLPAVHGARLFDEHERKNKRDKLDLECVETFDDVVIVLGSGSLPARERAAIVDIAAGTANVVRADALYARLRAHPLLAGAELNLEGLCVMDDGVVRLCQRGNGLGAIDATIDLRREDFLAYLHEGGPVPPLLDVRVHELGRVAGERLTLTDACAWGEQTFVTAAAERSPNAVDDGVVVGCALGVLGEPLGPIIDESGARFCGKPEGLALDPRTPGRAYVVVDGDDHRAPAEMLVLQLVGFP